MKVTNFTGSNGNKTANQFIIEGGIAKIDNRNIKGAMFQSYDKNIAFLMYDTHRIYLDIKYWDYSKTTAKYRNRFLNETKKETVSKIKSGEYKLINLNWFDPQVDGL